ncbi:MAG: hypothetical protein CL859_09815 [Cyanobium sp. ARS6]|nr:hypothetical protein [Cyanobium sp. ARS6]
MLISVFWNLKADGCQAEFIETSISSFSTRSSGIQADPKLFALLVISIKGANGEDKTTRAPIW